MARRISERVMDYLDGGVICMDGQDGRDWGLDVGMGPRIKYLTGVGIRHLAGDLTLTPTLSLWERGFLMCMRGQYEQMAFL